MREHRRTAVKLADCRAHVCPSKCKGEEKVTQPPGDVILTQGQTATLKCTSRSLNEYSYVFWYKQEVNSYPKFILFYYRGEVYNSPEFVKDRFDAELKDGSVPLRIRDLHVSDSAVYYCNQVSEVAAICVHLLGLVDRRTNRTGKRDRTFNHNQSQYLDRNRTTLHPKKISKYICGIKTTRATSQKGNKIFKYFLKESTQSSSRTDW
uniref:Ig-like domain-containing protein n=1 Tax=Gouania willdenowi TaxID=441366 RepID=A0A8C5DCW7_GOUWI